jgi:hypothetical protein
MPNSIPAEPVTGTHCDLIDDDDNTLTQKAKQSGSLAQPHLRIVHSADRLPDRLQDPSSVNMPPPDRPRSVTDRNSDRKPAMLDRTVQAQIGRMLREHFADVAGEPVPDRFVALLAELEAKEASR